MKILLLEPFFTGSHQQWAEGYRENSKHDIEIWSLSGHHWKWRMHAGAISFSIRSSQQSPPDVILATDMLDISTFRGLLPPAWTNVPIIAYFHENQLTYPWSDSDPDPKLRRDRHYSFINYTSALCANEVWFNSSFHKDSFVGELPDFLNAFPDEKNLDTIGVIREKSHVMPLGFDFSWTNEIDESERISNRIVWNHRWEYDKNPETFFQILMELKDEGYPFELAVLGQEFPHSPEIFSKAKEYLADNIVHWGFADSRNDYLKLLATCSIAPVTSNQDFFGISAIESIASGATPLLPTRLAFPEHLSNEEFYYSSPSQLREKLKSILSSGISKSAREDVLKYDWEIIANRYDARIEKIVTQSGK